MKANLEGHSSGSFLNGLQLCAWIEKHRLETTVVFDDIAMFNPAIHLPEEKLNCQSSTSQHLAKC